jgi:hypothetical protein
VDGNWSYLLLGGKLSTNLSNIHPGKFVRKNSNGRQAKFEQEVFERTNSACAKSKSACKFYYDMLYFRRFASQINLNYLNLEDL